MVRSGEGQFVAGTVGNAVGIASTDCSKNGTCVGMTANSGERWLAYGAVKDPLFDSSQLTLDAYSWLMHDSETEWKSLWSTNEPDLSAYRNAGGKILTYHGLAGPPLTFSSHPHVKGPTCSVS